MKNCSIVIVSYNSAPYLPYCLDSIFNDENLKSFHDIQVIIVDNASPNTGINEVKSGYPRVEWIFSKENLGFGKACNLGFKSVKHDFVLFLNPDTIILPHTLIRLYDFYNQSSNVGIVGGKVLNSDGTLQKACRRSFPSVFSALFKIMGLAELYPKSKILARYNLGHLDENSVQDVDAVSGSFFAISKGLYAKVNGFDEDFFLYGEDLDLCRRIQKLGFVNRYYPDAVVVHFKGQSSKTLKTQSFFHFYKAMIIFAKKHKDSYDLPLPIIQCGIYFAQMFHFMAVLLRPYWVWITIITCAISFVLMQEMRGMFLFLGLLCVIQMFNEFFQNFVKSKPKIAMMGDVDFAKFEKISQDSPFYDIIGYITNQTFNKSDSECFEISKTEDIEYFLKKMRIKELWMLADAKGVWYTSQVLAILRGIKLPIKIFLPLKMKNDAPQYEFLHLQWQSEKDIK